MSTLALLGGADSLVGGLLDPVLVPSHLISLLGLGLVAARGVLSVRMGIIAAFACGLAGGLGAIAWGVGETPANDVLMAIAAPCGLIAAAGIAMPAWLLAPTALICGIALGLDSPPDVVSLSDALLMLIGTACGGVAALAAAVTAASALSRPWHGVATRVAGSWIAAVAILALALRWS